MMYFKEFKFKIHFKIFSTLFYSTASCTSTSIFKPEKCMIFKNANIPIKIEKNLSRNHTCIIWNFPSHLDDTFVFWSEKLPPVKSCNVCFGIQRLTRKLTTPTPNLKKLADISTNPVYYYLTRLRILPNPTLQNISIINIIPIYNNVTVSE